jgi:hypothetical protein
MPILLAFLDDGGTTLLRKVDVHLRNYKHQNPDDSNNICSVFLNLGTYRHVPPPTCAVKSGVTTEDNGGSRVHLAWNGGLLSNDSQRTSSEITILPHNEMNSASPL